MFIKINMLDIGCIEMSRITVIQCNNDIMSQYNTAYQISHIDTNSS